MILVGKNLRRENFASEFSNFNLLLSFVDNLSSMFFFRKGEVCQFYYVQSQNSKIDIWIVSFQRHFFFKRFFLAGCRPWLGWGHQFH